MLLSTVPLSIDNHLKVVREAIWDIRAMWYDLGTELNIKTGTLQVSTSLICIVETESFKIDVFF